MKNEGKRPKIKIYAYTVTVMLAVDFFENFANLSRARDTLALSRAATGADFRLTASWTHTNSPRNNRYTEINRRVNCHLTRDKRN